MARDRLLLAAAVAPARLTAVSAPEAIPPGPDLSVAPVPNWVETAEVGPQAAPTGAEVAGAAVHHLLLDDRILVDGRRSSGSTHLVYRVLSSAGVEAGSQRELTFEPGFARVVRRRRPA